MSTNLNRLSEINTLEPVGFVPAASLSSPTSEWRAARLQNRFHDLGIVIERLFTFYEAMRTGKPVANGEEMLAQVRGALTRSTQRRSSVAP